ncbi:MAG: amino acid ABC transporter permease [Clostridia bacterium]|nr:amino acid ABC transporter permease [Clostridia bacterium]
MDFIGKFKKLWNALFIKGSGDGYMRVLTGLRNTVIIAVCGLLIGIVIGTLIAVVRVVPKTNRALRALDKLCTLYVAFFRGTPMVVQLLLGYFVLLPLMGVKLSSLMVCVLIFGLNSGAYVSEIMRSGLLSVDVGQTEAGRALGLSFSQTMTRIVVPQAVKNILPTLGNEFITLIKETSIVSFVGAVDLYSAFNYIGSANYEYMLPYLAMAVIYIIMVLGISGLIKLMERRLRKGDKR